jgi:hypothetical protein
MITTYSCTYTVHMLNNCFFNYAVYHKEVFKTGVTRILRAWFVL